MNNKFVLEYEWPLPDFDYFKYELEWDVNSMEDVIDSLGQWDIDELRQILGFPETAYYERKEK